MATNTRNSAVVALARLFWMLAGPAVLFVLAYYVAHHDAGWADPASIAFLVVLVGVIIARRLDSENSYGDPTTPAEIRTFTTEALVVGIVGWVIANLA